MEEPFLKFLRNSYEFFDETIPGGTEFPTNEIILLPPLPPSFFNSISPCAAREIANSLEFREIPRVEHKKRKKRGMKRGDVL